MTSKHHKGVFPMGKISPSINIDLLVKGSHDLFKSHLYWEGQKHDVNWIWFTSDCGLVAHVSATHSDHTLPVSARGSDCRFVCYLRNEQIELALLIDMYC